MKDHLMATAKMFEIYIFFFLPFRAPVKSYYFFVCTIFIQVSQAYKASVHDLTANHGFQVMPN